MRNAPDKFLGKNSAYFSSENCAVYEITWEKYGTSRDVTDDNTIQRTKYALCLPYNKGKNKQTLIIIDTSIYLSIFLVL